jgi:hypothetical protein
MRRMASGYSPAQEQEPLMVIWRVTTSWRGKGVLGWRLPMRTTWPPLRTLRMARSSGAAAPTTSKLASAPSPPQISRRWAWRDLLVWRGRHPPRTKLLRASSRRFSSKSTAITRFPTTSFERLDDEKADQTSSPTTTATPPLASSPWHSQPWPQDSVNLDDFSGFGESFSDFDAVSQIDGMEGDGHRLRERRFFIRPSASEG